MTPSQQYRSTGHAKPSKLLKGLDARVHSLHGVFQRRAQALHRLREEAELIDGRAAEVHGFSDHVLSQRLHEYRDRFRRGGNLPPELLHSALAALREAADRRLGLRPFLVQLMGALALHRGYLAEMATGEGKTLTAGLAAVLAGWTRQPCHIITVNDYLVQRDATWLKPFYEFCGVKVGFVTGTMTPPERRAGYHCDITYTTSKEVVADFLRDRLQMGALENPARRLIAQMLRPNAPAAQLVMRGLHSAIIDEADSVLIDEAVTPLIISAQQKNESMKEVARMAQSIASSLEPGTDYETNVRYREIEFTSQGKEKLTGICQSLPGLWRGPERRIELLRQAILAREFYHHGKQYIVADGKIVIVDEFTGRQMPQRTWRQGMHQAIEAKEGLPITDPMETIARLSFQRFFRLYRRMSGMTGTGREAASEFWAIYNLPVITIPPNKPCIRQHWPDRIFATDTEKWNSIVDEVHRLHATGRPILIGTRNIAASERVAELLQARGLHFRLLNAVRHQEEAQIISDAGLINRITIATNMAGRGTDVKLGDGVAELGGLHVIATERHESGRVDRQLFGRSARQGDPGSAQAFISLDDELLQRYLPQSFRKRVQSAVQLHWPASSRLALTAVSLAQRRAQKIAYRQRRTVLRTDDWLEEALSFTK